MVLHDIVGLLHLDDVLLVPVVRTEHGHRAPESDGDSVEGVVASILGIVSHGSDRSSVNPFALNYLKSVSLFLNLNNSSVQIYFDKEVEPLDFQRVTKHYFVLGKFLAISLPRFASVARPVTLSRVLREGTLLCLPKISVLVLDSVAPRWQLERGQRVYQTFS